jgi:hypothetical protein
VAGDLENKTGQETSATYNITKALGNKQHQKKHMLLLNT